MRTKLIHTPIQFTAVTDPGAPALGVTLRPHPTAAQRAKSGEAVFEHGTVELRHGDALLATMAITAFTDFHPIYEVRGPLDGRGRPQDSHEHIASVNDLELRVSGAVAQALVATGLFRASDPANDDD